MKYYLIYLKDKIKNYFKIKGKKIITTIGIQLLFLSLIIGIIAPISIYLTNNEPSEYLDIVIDHLDMQYDPRNMTIFDNMTSTPNIFLNPHTQSTYSDGSLSPETTIQWHIANGYNVMFMTDHNDERGGIEAERIAKEKYSDKIIVIPGVEWTNCRCHLGLIGIREKVEKIKWPTNKEIKKLIDWVHSKGGFVILNHVPWSFWAGLDQPTMDEWLEMGIDFLEVVNQGTIDYQNILYCKKHNLRYVTGIDLHLYTKELSWTVFNIPEAKQLKPTDPISSVVPTLTEKIIISTLRNQSTQTSFIFDAKGSIIKANPKNSPTNPKFIFLSPWIYIGRFFHSFFEIEKGQYSFVAGSCTEQIVNIHSNQLFSLITWALILFLICQVLYLLLKELSKFILKKFNKKGNKEIKKEDFEKNFNDSVEREDSDSSTNSEDPLQKTKSTFYDDNDSDGL
ncbi:hypothetical protein DICPUDRAFT_74921 [Dictyostelium purpureum]|uniref:Polymerase/histidinol phosphatase N-terminal domain-containing protein n=1 Tax=Dictyostelium purpureum TaxID=5786 RepID=F0Z948_DICPU|nr:uncharacterized protein DICPUDRAFT_74921 [Dictyostelium purpureum]EGC39516.1 hypothetical protein DICPUDRAFT_74921 [Dictyostelium purpureum]|eukprot:XP_003283963.1 hypothetical protein DICPUDRAFT_74921 [Dictyostelium purpureum]